MQLQSALASVFKVMAMVIETLLAVTMFVSIALSLILLQSEMGQFCVSETEILQSEGHWLGWLAFAQSIVAIVILAWKRSADRLDKEIIVCHERNIIKKQLFEDEEKRRRAIKQPVASPK